MQMLASFFVSLVAALNTVIPQANLPKVLAVGTEDAATRPAAVANIKLRRETIKAGLRVRLDALKDERKKKTVENLNEKLSMRQDNWVESWNKTLVRLKEVLAKLKAVSADTTEAEAAIAAAESAIADFSAKDYEISFTDEKNLGQGVRATISQVRTDAKVVHEALKKAKQALMTAARLSKGVR